MNTRLRANCVTSPPLNFLWIADPWAALDHPFDTTARLLGESIARSNVNYWCEHHRVNWEANDVMVRCRRVSRDSGTRQNPSVIFGHMEDKKCSDFDLIMMRVDPPVTRQYADTVQLISTSLERLGHNPEARIINPPQVLLSHSAKLLALLSHDTPRTIVSSNVDRLCNFARLEGIAVFKPLRRHQGSGIRLVNMSRGKQWVAELAACMTSNGAAAIVAQQYFRNHRKTEKRVWFAEGVVLGACTKRFQSGSFPPRLAKDTPIVTANLSDDEHRTCEQLGAILKKLKVHMAGVDLIDGFVTDVNVISPGLLVEMEQAMGQNLASRILELIEFPRLLALQRLNYPAS